MRKIEDAEKDGKFLMVDTVSFRLFDVISYHKKILKLYPDAEIVKTREGSFGVAF